jgi:hypothetical protein
MTQDSGKSISNLTLWFILLTIEVVATAFTHGLGTRIPVLSFLVILGVGIYYCKSRHRPYLILWIGLIVTFAALSLRAVALP